MTARQRHRRHGRDRQRLALRNELRQLAPHNGQWVVTREEAVAGQDGGVAQRGLLLLLLLLLMLLLLELMLLLLLHLPVGLLRQEVLLLLLPVVVLLLVCVLHRVVLLLLLHSVLVVHQRWRLLHTTLIEQRHGVSEWVSGEASGCEATRRGSGTALAHWNTRGGEEGGEWEEGGVDWSV